jgi:excisionase family DNA binding protein
MPGAGGPLAITGWNRSHNCESMSLTGGYSRAIGRYTSVNTRERPYGPSERSITISSVGETMYSAEEAAQILGLQVRTVRTYIRNGRLPGVRIGKQYRILRQDLESFTAGSTTGAAGERGTPGAAGPAEAAAPLVEISSVVQIDGVDAADGDRLERTLNAANSAHDGERTRPRVEALYDGERRRQKLILVGGLAETIELLRVIQLFAPDRR